MLGLSLLPQRGLARMLDAPSEPIFYAADGAGGFMPVHEACYFDAPSGAWFVMCRDPVRRTDPGRRTVGFAFGTDKAALIVLREQWRRYFAACMPRN